jgi:iron complex outermembrane receptor protein
MASFEAWSDVLSKDQASGEEVISEKKIDEKLDKILDLDLSQLLDYRVSVASLVEQSELDAGSAVFTITPKEWRMQGARTQSEALRQVPSTQVFDSVGQMEEISIRGFTYSSSLGTDYVLDGVPLILLGVGPAMSRSTFNLGVLNRIEVLRGPASTLYGTDALRGVVSIASYDSQKDEISANFDTGVGVNGGLPGRFYLGALRLSKEVLPHLRVQVFGGINGQGDQQLKTTYTDYQTQNVTLNGAIYTPTGVPIPYYQVNGVKTGELQRTYSAYTLGSKLQYHKSELEFFLSSLDNSGFSGSTYFGTLVKSPVTVNSTPSGSNPANLIWTDGTVNGATASMNTKLWILKASQSFSMSSSVDIDTKAYILKNTFDINSRPTNGDLTSHLSGQDQRLGVSLLARKPTNLESPVQWVAGYSADFLTVPSSETSTSTSSQSVTVANPNENSSRMINALFAQTDAGIFDNTFHIILGARYDSYNDLGTRHFSPRSGLIYHLTQDSAIKLLYGHAFRAPVSAESKGMSSFSLSNPDLKPETIDTLELLYMKKTKAWTASAGVFMSYWSDGIVTVPITSSAIATGVGIQSQNAQTSRSYGLESDGRYALTKNLSFTGSGSYVYSYAETSSGNSAYSMFPRMIFNWNVTYDNLISRLSLRLTGRHELSRTSAGPLAVNPAGTSVSPGLPAVSTPWAALGSPPQLSLPDYFRLDLNALYDLCSKPEQLQLSLSVRNLLNKTNYNPSIWGQLDNGIPEAGISGVIGLRATL